MKTWRLGVLLLSLLTFPVFTSYSFPISVQAESSPDVFVGVDVAYGDVAEVKAMVDQVSSYTNLIVIGSLDVAWNLTKLNATFQYAYDKGFSFLSLSPSMNRANRTGWLEYAQ